MVISDCIAKAVKIIGDASDTAYLDTKVFVKYVLGYSDTELVLNKNKDISNTDAEKILEMASQRKTHKPVSYIVGFKEFMSLDFDVSESVLIPRADTECVVEEIIKCESGGNILDIGTGSGAICVSLAKYIKNSNVYSIDISNAAIEIAKRNAKNNDVYIEFINESIFDYKTDIIFDCIVSNPPYIRSDDCLKLQADLKDFEPILALDGGGDGLKFYKRIIEFAKTNLISGGSIYFECGFDQFDDIETLLASAGFVNIKPIYDLASIKRGVSSKKE